MADKPQKPVIFQSQYQGHGIWIGKTLVKFRKGLFTTEDPKLIEELSHPRFKGFITRLPDKPEKQPDK